MLNKNGFLFVEILMGLFILGIITVTCLPLISTSIDNMRLARIKTDMAFFAESAMEKILNYDPKYTNDDYIFDISLCELIEIFAKNESVVVDLPLDDEYYCNYRLRICKNSFNEKLWKIHVEASSGEEGGKIENVIFRSIIPSKGNE